MTTKLLVVDDEPEALSNLTHILKKEGYAIRFTRSGQLALKYLEEEEFTLILTDLKMKKVDGMQLLRRARKLYPDTEVIMITGYATVDSAVEAIKAGAYHYITKPYKLDEVRKVVKDALKKIHLKKENSRLSKYLEDSQDNADIITDNPKMKKILKTARQLAGSDINVVICGESGTGKELVARLIHSRSKRRTEPMLSINCGVFTKELLANELFGHEKGAFTGASEIQKGLVEKADKGTLFLDEITEMSPDMQVKLLRIIQEREFMRVGGTRAIKVDIRFITATNRDLSEEVKNGNFRQDLFFRINVASLFLPPLSERKSDIPLLTLHFLKLHSAIMGKNIKNITPEILETLMRYDFPGNVRELENIIECGVALTNENTIKMAHLPDHLQEISLQTFRKKKGKYPTLKELEISYIEWLLKETGNNKTEAAGFLGIDRVSLWRKLKQSDICS